MWDRNIFIGTVKAVRRPIASMVEMTVELQAVDSAPLEAAMTTLNTLNTLWILIATHWIHNSTAFVTTALS